MKVIKLLNAQLITNFYKELSFPYIALLNLAN